MAWNFKWGFAKTALSHLLQLADHILLLITTLHQEHLKSAFTTYPGFTVCIIISFSNFTTITAFQEERLPPRPNEVTGWNELLLCALPPNHHVQLEELEDVDHHSTLVPESAASTGQAAVSP